MFLRCDSLSSATSTADIICIWKGSRTADDWEWNLYLDFVSYCVSDEYQLGKDIDEASLDDLGCVANKDGVLTIVERLLVASNSR